MTFDEAQAKVDLLIRQHGGYYSELTNLGILTEETGELARWIVRKYGDQNMKPSEKNVNTEEAIADELTDILWVLLCLSNQMNINLTSAFEQNISKKKQRDQYRHIGH